eukprot:CAMPEP_0116564174 /NCGR_PEP_ID=MMETSP0397-20121206/13159_1 /TAXON_ID=216820 /ORGANISM="Cyclophora tenuis, Strain ECT3854" /LENGTH=122 /DNA_ID=CAMNT_0004090733 /DNA_START=69 /DNA_END=437 /DNA_ORIENTATION=-
MASLQLAVKARQLVIQNKPARLYRSICKEIPRVLIIYDIDMPFREAATAVRGLFHENAHLRDERVLDMVIEKGYMELEETLLQHKQRSHLLRLLEGYVIPTEGSNRKRLTLDATPEDQFNRN